LEQLAPAVHKLHARWSKQLNTAALNRWMRNYTALKPHPDSKGRAVKLKFIAQTAVRPPTFQISANRAKLVSEVRELCSFALWCSSFGSFNATAAPFVHRTT
jgi:predicted GTPase